MYLLGNGKKVLKSISRAILDQMCRQEGNVEEFHVLIGSYHVDGIRERLSTLLKKPKFEIIDDNIMLPKSVPKVQAPSQSASSAR